MGIIVQKFGGTSLKNISKESEFLKHIKKEVSEGNNLVIVVSAMGRNGDPYATDTLIKQLEKIYKKIDPRKKDLIMSCGETISAAIVSHLLESEGLPAEPLTGFQAGILTDENFNSGKILGINTSKIFKILNRNKIVVVAGFQGMTSNMDITTLGRGGSDTSAVALGGFLKADRVDIFTDVTGIAITDPRIIPNVKYIEKISYDDMYKLASNGATVIHPNAVELGREFKIPIRVLSTFENNSGTLISNYGNNKEKIIGIGIKKHDEDEAISIIFNPEYRDVIMVKLDEFISEEREKILSINHSEYKVTLLVKDEEKTYIVQKLYDFLIESQLR
jgi:aspartate kinase